VECRRFAHTLANFWSQQRLPQEVPLAERSRPCLCGFSPTAPHPPWICSRWRFHQTSVPPRHRWATPPIEPGLSGRCVLDLNDAEPIGSVHVRHRLKATGVYGWLFFRAPPVGKAFMSVA